MRQLIKPIVLCRSCCCCWLFKLPKQYEEGRGGVNEVFAGQDWLYLRLLGFLWGCSGSLRLCLQVITRCTKSRHQRQIRRIFIWNQKTTEDKPFSRLLLACHRSCQTRQTGFCKAGFSWWPAHQGGDNHALYLSPKTINNVSHQASQKKKDTSFAQWNQRLQWADSGIRYALNKSFSTP